MLNGLAIQFHGAQLSLPSFVSLVAEVCGITSEVAIAFV
jgi:hypothetical protein